MMMIIHQEAKTSKKLGPRIKIVHLGKVRRPRCGKELTSHKKGYGLSKNRFDFCCLSYRVRRHANNSSERLEFGAARKESYGHDLRPHFHQLQGGLFQPYLSVDALADERESSNFFSSTIFWNCEIGLLGSGTDLFRREGRMLFFHSMKKFAIVNRIKAVAKNKERSKLSKEKSNCADRSGDTANSKQPISTSFI